MSQATPDKPLPTITNLTQPFWSAAKTGRLVLQKCQRCATFNFHPKPWCIDCGSRELVWTDAQPTGTVTGSLYVGVDGVLYRYSNRTADLYEDDVPAAMKKLTGERMGLGDYIAMETEKRSRIRQLDDTVEAFRAFVEKRPPVFTGT